MSSALTSDFLRKRGHCCKSNCLHCPYGTTLRNIGLKLLSYSEETKEEIDELISRTVSSQAVNELLAGAFGEQKSYSSELAHLITLKEITCGICYIKNAKVVELYLKEEFSNQGITKSYLEATL